jgi:hypothetical protein
MSEQTVSPTPPRLPNRRGAEYEKIRDSNPTAYDEALVESEFKRAGFTETDPYLPKHSTNPQEMLATGRNPEKAVRMIGEALTPGAIDNWYHMGAALGQRRAEQAKKDPRHTRSGIDRQTRNDWGNLDQNNERAKARQAALLQARQQSAPQPTIQEATTVETARRPKSHGTGLLNWLFRRQKR